jgi:amino-acid N-acetyltransferase
MTDSTQYARWFRDSTPYISAHRHRTFVIMLGGDAIVHENITNIVHDLALLSVLGVRVVLVHGARPQIDAALAAAGLPSVFHGHRRVTDGAAVELVQSAVGRVRTQIEGLFSMGLPNTPLHNTKIHVVSGNLVTARPIGVQNGVDHLFTGQVRRIHGDLIHRMLDERTIVLQSPLGYSPSGEAYNLSSDELAADIAIHIGADKFIAFDSAGKLRFGGEERAEVTPAQLDSLLDSVDFAAPTRLRLAELLRASRAGVSRCHLVAFPDDGALLRELFTASGAGTQISEQGFQHIRPATAEDVAAIVELIRPLEDAGVLVRRQRDRLEQEAQRFFVAELDGIVIGCCALYPYPDAATAEFACLATHPGYREATGAEKIGGLLLKRAETEARRQGLGSLFVLTTQTRDWFRESGFSEASVDNLPAPKKSLYNYQRNSTVMIKTLD